MNERNALGPRIRAARASRAMTLKDVEAASGVSATHLSEIERGRTSPTIGALARIAEALGRSVAFLLEERTLPDVSLVTPGEHVERGGATGAVWRHLTTSIPGARMDARQLTPAADAKEPLDPVDLTRFAVVLRGAVVAATDDLSVELGEGDLFRVPPGQRAWIGVPPGGGADVLLLTVRDADGVLL